MESPFPVFPIRLMIRQIRRMYRPFLIRPAHSYFFPAYLRSLPRRWRVACLPAEEGSQFSAPVSDSPDHSQFPF